MGTECRATEASDAGIVEQPIGQLLGCEAGTGNVGERVEGPAGIAHRNPGIPFSAPTMASRRRRNSSTMAVTQACGPSSAAMPARCVKLAVHELELTVNKFTASASHVGMTP